MPPVLDRRLNRPATVQIIKASMSATALATYRAAMGLDEDLWRWSDADLLTACERVNAKPMWMEEQPRKPIATPKPKPAPTAAPPIVEKPSDGKMNLTELTQRVDALEETRTTHSEAAVLAQKAVVGWARADLPPILKKERAEMRQYIDTAIEALRPKQLDIRVDADTVIRLEGYTHPKFEDALRIVSLRLNLLMIGPAGCGKTKMGSQLAEALALRFGSLSCTSGMSESSLTGRLFPTMNGAEFISTEFIDFVENGGVFLLDEIDAADANVLLVINQLMANGYLPVPNRPAKPVARKHKDFILIAAANTFGTGANRIYVGRNQLDEATLDRFRAGQLIMDYDGELEKVLCPDRGLRERVWTIRKAAALSQLRVVVSTRFLQDAYLLRKGGWSENKVVDQLLSSWTPDMRTKVGAPAKGYEGGF